MAEKYDPPMSEALMALFATAAPLFERAKAAGIFRPPVNAEVSPPAPPPHADDGGAAQKAALQEIIVAQAMKIVALEAEVARLKG